MKFIKSYIARAIAYILSVVVGMPFVGDADQPHTHPGSAQAVRFIRRCNSCGCNLLRGYDSDRALSGRRFFSRGGTMMTHDTDDEAAVEGILLQIEADAIKALKASWAHARRDHKKTARAATKTPKYRPFPTDVDELLHDTLRGASSALLVEQSRCLAALTDSPLPRRSSFCLRVLPPHLRHPKRNHHLLVSKHQRRRQKAPRLPR